MKTTTDIHLGKGEATGRFEEKRKFLEHLDQTRMNGTAAGFVQGKEIVELL